MSIVVQDFAESSDAAKTYLRTLLIPTYFASYSSSDSWDNYKDSNGNILLAIYQIYLNSKYCTSIRVFKSSDSFYATAYSLQSGQTAVISKIISCDGGVLIIADGMGCIITRNNNGGITTIVRDNYTNGTTDQQYKYQGVRCFSWGDITTSDKSLTFSPQSFSQTQLIPFVTYCQYNTTNYTPDAFWMPFSEFYEVNSGKFLGPDGVEYITNGYWAIRDQNSLASG